MYWCGVVVVSYGAVSTCNLQVPTSRFILMVGVSGVIEPMITGSIFHLYPRLYLTYNLCTMDYYVHVYLYRINLCTLSYLSL